MTRFRHDLLLRIVKVLDAVMLTIPFALCWYLYYAKRIVEPFYEKGSYLVVALFFVLYIIFGRVYDAFLMSLQRISEVVYAQFLAAAVSDFIMYIVIWLLNRHLPNLLPGGGCAGGADIDGIDLGNCSTPLVLFNVSRSGNSRCL